MDLVKSRLLRGTNHSLDRDLRKLSGTTSTLAGRTHERKKPQAPAPTNSKPRRWYDRIIPHPNDPRHAKILSLPKTPHSPNERDYEIARPPATLKFRTRTAVFPGFPTVPGRRIGARERSPGAPRSGTASSRRGRPGPVDPSNRGARLGIVVVVRGSGPYSFNGPVPWLRQTSLRKAFAYHHGPTTDPRPWRWPVRT